VHALGPVRDGRLVGFIDVREDNHAAMSLAQRYGMKEAFGSAKMYFGLKPALPETEIFAITTLEPG